MHYIHNAQKHFYILLTGLLANSHRWINKAVGSLLYLCMCMPVYTCTSMYVYLDLCAHIYMCICSCSCVYVYVIVQYGYVTLCFKCTPI